MSFDHLHLHSPYKLDAIDAVDGTAAARFPDGWRTWDGDAWIVASAADAEACETAVELSIRELASAASALLLSRYEGLGYHEWGRIVSRLDSLRGKLRMRYPDWRGPQCSAEQAERINELHRIAHAMLEYNSDGHWLWPNQPPSLAA